MTNMYVILHMNSTIIILANINELNSNNVKFYTMMARQMDRSVEKIVQHLDIIFLCLHF